MSFVSEEVLEDFLMGEMSTQGFHRMHGNETTPDPLHGQTPLRSSYHETLLEPVLLDALRRINPDVPESYLVETVKRITDPVFHTDLVRENERIHHLLTSGAVYELNDEDDNKISVRLVDWTNTRNDWRVVNQFDVVGETARIPDVVVFLNGMPLVVIELKGMEAKDIGAAFNQIETYKADIPDLFRTTLFNVISDGHVARYGTISANLERYMTWRTLDGETILDNGSDLALETLIHGLLNQRTLLDILQSYVVFEDEGTGPIKKIPGYHQFFAVQKAVDSVLAARGRDNKGGVIWHTQGSGKSLLMAFLAGRLATHPDLENPTLVVLTDRNDLDDQLFATFSRCRVLWGGSEPIKATSVADLQEQLDRSVGGIIFSTIQKFKPEPGKLFPTITERSNVIVMVDEAHRSQYGFDATINKGGDVRYGLAHQMRLALPNAVYLGMTGTPIELVGANTRGVFGDYIDIYNISRAVEDGATVPIYYEARVAKITMDTTVAGHLDEDFDDVTEDMADDEKNDAKRKWSQVEALVGADKRLDTVVADMLEHYDARIKAIDGKAMIVCMSRRICVEVYNRIVALRPDWHGATDATGVVKVMMTGGASDPASMQPHIRPKVGRNTIRDRYKDVNDPLRIVIVCDMWLTGFDAPCMHTLYVDKPLKGHGLMQAIARVNRVFQGKPAGLVVDYIGIASSLQEALSKYSSQDQQGTGIDEALAVTAFKDALGVIRDQMYGFPYTNALHGTGKERLLLVAGAINFLLTKNLESGATNDAAADSKEDTPLKRYAKAVVGLVRGYKLASGNPQATQHAAEVAFFCAVQRGLEKLDMAAKGKTSGSSDFAIQQLVNTAVASTEIVDILEACGFDRPDISILSDGFLRDVQSMEHKNLAVEALKKLLNGQISARSQGNITREEQFSKRLEQTIARYHNRSVDAITVIQELINIAKDLQAEPEDNLTPAERAFYDALSQNKSAVDVMGNRDLQIIATRLVQVVQNTTGPDWWKREDVRAKMRIAVKRILKEFNYPPDLALEAVQKILRQAEAIGLQNKSTRQRD